ncbi:hypothetical protein OPT61_g2722 [Boeremia exigua]|uniref:Uncharacterized protein n=1 Tax=Boeremia exigua TaxID=749465 RepID=A0ACC2IKP6_9PLEO|nr:hypothetical protein OPT61_g2722 [Boeremia exigua]
MANYDLNNYLRQMESFRAADHARDNLVNELIEKFSSLLREHAELKSDYLSERDNRRNYQSRIEDAHRAVSDHERQLDANSFVLALIDGDGAIFQDTLLQAAAGDGGSEAASRLHHAIHNHISSLYGNSGSWPIMVQVYLSLDKLAFKLQQVGLLRHPQDLRSFAQRFSVNQPLFSIIDVGQGKERADHKIKEMLRTFSDNPTCRHIIFGGCHDAGYLLNLDQFKHNEAKAGRITLLESTPAYRGFAELPNFKRANFDDVFRNEPLPDSAPAINTSVTSAQSPAPSTQAIITRTLTNRTPPAASALPAALSPSPSTPAPSVSTTASSEDSTWASVGKLGTERTNKVSLVSTAASKASSKKKYAYYNKLEQRLDEPLPARDRAAAESLDARMKKTGKKMCNNFHLGGSCTQGKFCHFQHEPRLPPGELVALRYKARSLACNNRYCEDIDCYLGHQCANERDFGFCRYEGSCHLRATHGMDREKALVDYRLASQAVVSDHAEHKSGEPDDQAQEGERLRRLPLAAVIAAAQADSTPSPRATAPSAVEPDDQHREHGGPTCCEDWCALAQLDTLLKEGMRRTEVRAVRCHGRLGGDHPYDREDDRERGPHNGEDYGYTHEQVSSEDANVKTATLARRVVLAHALGYEVMRRGGAGSKQLQAADMVPMAGTAMLDFFTKWCVPGSEQSRNVKMEVYQVWTAYYGALFVWA